MRGREGESEGGREGERERGKGRQIDREMRERVGWENKLERRCTDHIVNYTCYLLVPLQLEEL